MLFRMLLISLLVAERFAVELSQPELKQNVCKDLGDASTPHLGETIPSASIPNDHSKEIVDGDERKKIVFDNRNGLEPPASVAEYHARSSIPSSDVDHTSEVGIGIKCPICSQGAVEAAPSKGCPKPSHPECSDRLSNDKRMSYPRGRVMQNEGFGGPSYHPRSSAHRYPDPGDVTIKALPETSETAEGLNWLSCGLGYMCGEVSSRLGDIGSEVSSCLGDIGSEVSSRLGDICSRLCSRVADGCEALIDSIGN